MSSNYKTIGIHEEFKNGLKFMAAKENRRTAGNMLDTILRNSGVPKISERELRRRLHEISSQQQKTEVLA